MISKRIKLISSMIDHAKLLVDVGTDHGFLPIECVKSNKVEKAVASDINEMPLEKCIENIKKEHLEAKISTVLSNGLEKITFDYDHLVITGMGGSLIVSLLQSDNLRDSATLTLSPNNNHQLVRQFLDDNNYEIIKEDFFVDKGKYYQVFQAVIGKKMNLNPYELRFGRMNIQQQNNCLKNFILQEKNKLQKALINAKNQEEVLNKIKFLEEVFS